MAMKCDFQEKERKKKKEEDFEECPQRVQRVWRLELLLGPVNANECESERAAAMRYIQGHVRLFSALRAKFVSFPVSYCFFSSASTDGRVWSIIPRACLSRRLT